MPYFELKKDEVSFPPAYFADIDGLLAVGGTMSVERLLLAYNSGIYYWHYPLKHIKWWSPDPRIVLKPYSFEMSKSQQKNAFKDFDIQVDAHFEEVLRGCQRVYNIQDRMNNNWLSERMVRLFMELHQKGYAHSIEVWQNNDLVGGLFGVAIGKLFFGEYVFAKVERADEAAMVYLIEKLKNQNYHAIDMQKESFLLPGFEYDEMPRLEYVDLCKENARLYPEVSQNFKI
ncbi:MAG: leucyl/phenylalanyl-tRNA--protein transferase [Bacteroidota bacterium]|nr:leucyl/phenylalanyl-tRNA--protein transferase [Bacteroidota bacterium]